MSKPESAATIQSISLELCYASSALHCPPEPVDPPADAHEQPFLSETDAMVQHSLEHIQQAQDNLRALHQKIVAIVEGGILTAAMEQEQINPAVSKALYALHRDIYKNI